MRVSYTPRGLILSRRAMEAAVPTAWPMAPQVAMTRVELMAVWVTEIFRPANIRFSTLREYRQR